MAAHELFGQGNEAFVAENFKGAIEFYNKAILEDQSKEGYYTNRARAHIKLESYIDAVADATKAIELDTKNPHAFLQKGIASFHLEEFESAKKSFTEGLSLDDSDNGFSMWIQKCEEELKRQPGDVEPGDVEPGDVEPTVSEDAKDSTPKPDEIPMPSGPQTKYDWYQTDSTVVITILLKKINKEDLKTEIQDKTLSVTVVQDGKSDYSLELDLLHPIDPKTSVIKILNSKIEIKLKKIDGIRWNKLEGEPESSAKQFVPNVGQSTAQKYPSSSPANTDWDKVVADIKKEEKDEKLEGDAALNSLFHQIYRDGSDEVRKAMNKSFVESAGTVLSTNWTDVGAKDVTVKPPDGMEFKKWDN